MHRPGTMRLPFLQYGAEVLTEVTALLDETAQFLEPILPLQQLTQSVLILGYTCYTLKHTYILSVN